MRPSGSASTSIAVAARMAPAARRKPRVSRSRRSTGRVCRSQGTCSKPSSRGKPLRLTRGRLLPRRHRPRHSVLPQLQPPPRQLLLLLRRLRLCRRLRQRPRSLNQSALQRRRQQHRRTWQIKERRYRRVRVSRARDQDRDRCSVYRHRRHPRQGALFLFLARSPGL